MSKTTKKIEFPTSLSVRDLAQSLEASPIDVIKEPDEQWCDGFHQPVDRL